MKFFIDTANIDEIKEANDMGLVDGVTTNPSLIAKEGRDFEELTVCIFTVMRIFMGSFCHKPAKS